MLQVDNELLQGKIDIIERNINFLNGYQSMDVGEFLNDFKDIQAAKFSLFEIIEASINIASHIISKNGFKRAESYSEMFQILGNEKIIDSRLGDRLSAMARFRNLLIHSYGEIDNSKVLSYIKLDLIDVKNFIRELLKKF